MERLLIGADVDAGAFLAEPPDLRAPLWAACVYARIVLASRGGAYLGTVDDAVRARLEEAGWLAIADEASYAAARAAAWPALAELAEMSCVVGSSAPRIVVVGERPGKAGLARPFQSTSGGWLLRALRALGYDELTVLFANAALGRERRPDPAHLVAIHDAVRRYEPTWLACGRVAEEALRRAKIPHAHVVHPAHHRRFHAADGHLGYAELIKGAGVPPGPWHERELPRVEGGDADALLAAACVPRTLAHRPDGDKRRSYESRVHPEKLDRARELYVRGETPTLKHAAREAGVPYQTILTQSRAQGWYEARQRYLEEVRRRADDRSADVEAKAIAAARKLAWGGATQALKSVLDRMRGGELKPSPRDAKALVDAAITLHQLRAVALDDEQRRALRNLPLPELARRLKREVEERFGPLEEG